MGFRPKSKTRTKSKDKTTPTNAKTPRYLVISRGIWRTQEESKGCSKDEGNPAFSKSSAPSLWPSAAQRARKRAKFTMPEHVEFVGNWEKDEVVEKTMVELN